MLRFHIDHFIRSLSSEGVVLSHEISADWLGVFGGPTVKNSQAGREIQETWQTKVRFQWPVLMLLHNTLTLDFIVRLQSRELNTRISQGLANAEIKHCPGTHSTSYYRKA